MGIKTAEHLWAVSNIFNRSMINLMSHNRPIVCRMFKQTRSKSGLTFHNRILLQDMIFSGESPFLRVLPDSFFQFILSASLNILNIRPHARGNQRCTMYIILTICDHALSDYSRASLRWVNDLWPPPTIVVGAT